MGLIPEFFMLLGIDIFVAMSLLAALLDDELPSTVQYLSQGAALVGLGQLFISRGFVDSGVFSKDPADPTRFWISVVYLSSAVFAVVGLNAYLGIVRRKMALATTFAGTVTVPIMMVSAFFVTSFLSTNGDVTATLGGISILVIAVSVSALSIVRFLKQATKLIGTARVGSNEPSLPPQSDMGVSTSETEAPGPAKAPPEFPPSILPAWQGILWGESPEGEGEAGK
jgi:putative Mn2+ efflux pump MntP